MKTIRTATGLVAAALIIALVLLAQGARAQTANQWYFQKKNAGAGFTGYGVTPIAGRAFGLDGSGNPAMLSISGGSGLENILSSITGDTLTFTGTLTAPRAITWRDLAGTVAFTSDLTAYLTTSTAASTYATIAHNQGWSTITSTPTTLAGYGITDAITAAAAASTYATIAHNQAWSTITSTPTTLAGYGITDAITAATAASTYAPISDPAFTGSASFGGVISASNGMTTPAVTFQGDASGPQWEHQSSTGLTASKIELDALSSTERDAVTWYLRSNLGGTIALLADLESLNGSNVTSGTVAAARLGSGSSITTKFLRGDNTWQTIAGGGDALTSASLDQFADVTQTATKTLAITESTTLAGGTHSGTNTGDQTTITGNAATATALQTGRAINGVTFDGTAAITVTAAAGTLTGTTLASNVVTSSLTSLGTISTGVWQGAAIADGYISSAASWNAKQAGDADLTTYAGITPSANVQSLLSAADYAAMRSQLGLVIGTNVQAYDAELDDLADGSLTGTLVAAASTSARGSVELATDGETTSGLAVQANDNRLVDAEKIEIGVACSDETTAVTTGTAKVTFRAPFAFTLTAVRASTTTANTGSTLVIDINESGTTVLSTKLSLDASEKTSTTAATAAVISDSAIADDAEITIDFDQVGSTIAGAGVKVWLIGTR